MKKIVIRWPELNMAVECEPIADNRKVYDVFCENLPIRTVQGHEMVGGWVLRDRAVHYGKKPFDFTKSELKEAALKDLPVGTISLLFPQGTTSELVINYDENVDDRKYVPFAKVIDADIDTLKNVGKKTWQSYIRTHEVITCEFKGGEN